MAGSRPALQPFRGLVQGTVIVLLALCMQAGGPPLFFFLRALPAPFPVPPGARLRCAALPVNAPRRHEAVRDVRAAVRHRPLHSGAIAPRRPAGRRVALKTGSIVDSSCFNPRVSAPGPSSVGAVGSRTGRVSAGWEAASE